MIHIYTGASNALPADAKDAAKIDGVSGRWTLRTTIIPMALAAVGTLPVATYAHGSDEGGCSVTGGYVYRGAAFPQLEGVYLYADYCTGNLWGLRAPFAAGDSALLATLDLRITSFGEDEAGELYVADREGGAIYRLTAE